MSEENILTIDELPQMSHTMPEEYKPMNILEEAKAAVEDREKKYGSPIHDFKRQAGMLAALGYCFQDEHGDLRPIIDTDMALIQICVKLSRETNEFTQDNKIDVIGYVLCLQRILEEKFDKK